MGEQPDEYQRAIRDAVAIIDTYADEQMRGDEWWDAAITLKNRILGKLIERVMARDAQSEVFVNALVVCPECGAKRRPPRHYANCPLKGKAPYEIARELMYGGAPE